MFKIGQKVIVVAGDLKDAKDPSKVAQDMKGMTGIVSNYTDLGGDNLHQVLLDKPTDLTGPHQFFKPEQLQKLS